VTCLDSPVLFVEISSPHVKDKVSPVQSMMACFEFQVSKKETPVSEYESNAFDVNSQFANRNSQFSFFTYFNILKSTLSFAGDT
jgi:hypothetical protein